MADEDREVWHFYSGERAQCLDQSAIAESLPEKHAKRIFLGVIYCMLVFRVE
jgi:hypothetical protein